MRIPAGSIEYVHVDITVTRDDIPAPSSARMAVLPRGTAPTETAWRPATVVSDTTIRSRYDGDYPPGVYTVWVEITAGDEIPLVEAGRLDLT